MVIFRALCKEKLLKAPFLIPESLTIKNQKREEKASFQKSKIFYLSQEIEIEKYVCIPVLE